MKGFKRILNTFPEYYLIALVLLAGYTPPLSIHPVSIAIACLVVLQIIFRNKLVELVMGSLLLLGSLFMFFAVVSELGEFTSYGSNYVELLVGGIGLIGFNLLMVFVMFYRFQEGQRQFDIKKLSDLNG